jgi:hypothetical protein
MRSIVAAAVVSLALSAADAGAQRLPEPELGFRVGYTRLSADDGFGNTEKLNIISVPGMMFLSPGGIHFMFFVTEKVSLEPQLGFLRTSEGDASSSLLFLALQPNLFLGSDARRAPYIFATVGLLRDSDSFSGSSNTDTQNVFGGGIGYRRVVRNVLSTRYELRLRRFSADGPGGQEINEIGVLVGLGVVIPRATGQ